MTLSTIVRCTAAVAAALLACTCNRPLDKDTIVRINDRTISVAEFESRLNTLPNTLHLTADDIKETLLCTLIAEAILRDKADAQEIDSLQQIMLHREQYEKEAIYEKWMASEVQSRVSITEQDVLSAYERFKEVRGVAYWTADNIQSASALRHAIAQGKKSAQEPQLKEIEYGESLESVEDAIFGLRDQEVSQPLEIDGVFYVFVLLKKLPHPEYAQHDLIFWRSSVEKRVRARKEMMLSADMIDAMMKGKQYSINRSAYDILVGRLSSMIFENGELRNETPGFVQQEISAREIQQGTDDDQLLISFSEGVTWTLGDVWKKLSVCPYPLNFRTPEELKHGLLGVLRRIILFESIVRDGMNKGYNTSPYVRQQTAIWYDNSLARALLTSYRTSVPVNDSVVIKYYESTKMEHLQPEMRKIIPIIVRSKAAAERLSQRINEGADVLELARQTNIASIAFNKKDAAVYIDRDSWGEIGKVAFTLQPGQVSRPFRNSDSTYAVVKLLEVRAPEPYPLKEVGGRLKSVLEERNVQEKVEGILLRSIHEYKVSINRPALKKIEYLGGTLAVRKSHFPLRNAAPNFPLFSPKAAWYTDILH